MVYNIGYIILHYFMAYIMLGLFSIIPRQFGNNLFRYAMLWHRQYYDAATLQPKPIYSSIW